MELSRWLGTVLGHAWGAVLLVPGGSGAPLGGDGHAPALGCLGPEH